MRLQEQGAELGGVSSITNSGTCSDSPHQARSNHHHLSPVFLDTVLGCVITLRLHVTVPSQTSIVTFLQIFCYMFLRTENHDVARRELYGSAVQTPAQSRANTKRIRGTSITPHRCRCYFSRMWRYPNNVLGLFQIPFLNVPNTVLAFLTKLVNKVDILKHHPTSSTAFPAPTVVQSLCMFSHCCFSSMCTVLPYI